MSVFNSNHQQCQAPNIKLRCLTCLSLDRELKPLQEQKILALLCPELFSNTTPTFTNAVQMICWECKAMMLKIKEFRSRVTKAQEILKLSAEKGYYFCEDLSTLKATKVNTVNIAPQPSSPIQTVTLEVQPLEPKKIELEIAKIEPLFEEDEPLPEEDESLITIEVKKEKRDSFSGGNDELIQPITVQQTDTGETTDTASECETEAGYDHDPLLTVRRKPEPQKKNVERYMKTMDTPTLNYKPQNYFKNTRIPQITGLKGSKEKVNVAVGASNVVKIIPTPGKGKKIVPSTVKATTSIPTTVKGTTSVPTTVKGTTSVPTTVKVTKSVSSTEKGKEIVVPKHAAVPNTTKNNSIASTVTNINEVQLGIYGFDNAEVECKIMTRAEMQKYMDSKRNDPIFKGIRYKCMKCIEGFGFQEKLDCHNKKHDVSSGNFVCDICDQRFVLKDELDEHYKPHFIVYNCLSCSYQHSDRYKISEHIRRRHQISEFKCKKCNSVFQTYKEMNRHKVIVHYEKPTCKECGKTFTSRYIMKSHEASFHKSERVTCSKCGKNVNAHHLKSHMKKHEDNPRDAVYCVECNVYLKNQVCYNIHLKKSLKHNPIEKVGFKCDMCGKCVATKATLLDHIELEHNGDHFKYTCKVCNNVYKSKNGLKTHMQYQHEGKKHKETKKVVCEICGKAFKNKPHLKCHINSHFGRRPFTCQDCGDTFTYSGALWTHRKLVHKVQKKSEMKKAEMQK